MRMLVFMLMAMRLPLPELFPRQLFFPMSEDIDLRRADAAAINPRKLQPGLDAKCCHRVFEQMCTYTRIYEGAQEHVATDARETVEIS
jgi:hypothetical protein